MNNSNTVEVLLMAAKEKQLEPEALKQLLNAVRSGDITPIPLLVGGLEIMIINIAENYQNSGLSMAHMIKIGKDALTKLAEQEVNSEISERFFRFCAWCIKQNILAEIVKIEK